MQHIILISIGLAVIIDILLLAVLAQKQTDGLVRIFKHMVLGAMFWNTCTFLFILTEQWALAPLAYISALYFFVARHIFVMRYTNTEAPRENKILIGIAIALSLLAFVPHALFVNPHVSLEGYIFVGNGWFTVYFACYLIYMTMRPLQILFRHTLSTKSHELRILTLGLSIYAIITISTNLILPIFFDVPFLNTIGPAFSSLFSLIIFYAIHHYQFLHIKLIIQRGIIFSVLFGFSLTLYALIAGTFVTITRDVTPNNIIIALTILIATLIVPRLEGDLRRITDNFLLQQHYSYRQTIRKLAAIFAHNTTTTNILRHTLSYLKHTLRVRSMKYREGDIVPEKFKLQNTSFPIYTSNNIIRGYLLIGPKKSNDPFTRVDRNLIESYSLILGVALEKARLFEHLEEEIATRTNEIAHLHESERVRLATLAHDLKTPLTTLLGTHELITRSPEITRSHFDALELPIRNIARTIHEIVNFESTFTTPHSRFSLSHLMGEISEHMSVLCDMEHVTFTSDTPPNLVLLGDERNIELLVNIILSNALRYHSNTAPSISLSVKQEGGSLHIIVRDNGIGIPEDDIDHIFTRNYRGRNTATREGSGKGLTIAQEIATAHNATIDVVSIENVGTTVTIVFQTNAVHSA